MRRTVTLIAILASILAFSLGRSASADPGDGHVNGVTDPLVLALIGDDDLFSLADLTTVLAPADPAATQHFGPFASGSPDSGTCGNSWAEDQFNRFFTVRAAGPGAFTIVEQFKDGTFVTNAGASPGACDETDGTPPGTVAAGIDGTLHGYEIISLTGTQTSHDASCIAGAPTAPCTTGGFITSHFGGTFTVGTFFFHYAGFDGSNQALVVNEWKNASCDRGGNHGDIATANTGLATPPLACVP